jgi:hypothetical protein
MPVLAQQDAVWKAPPSFDSARRTAVLIADPRLGGRRWRRAELVVMAIWPPARRAWDQMAWFPRARRECADGSGNAVLGQPAGAGQQPLVGGWGQVHG